MAGRDHVRPDDIKSLAAPVLAHRLIPRDGYGPGQRKQGVDLVRAILDRTPVPV
jgi:MoxR-like ATPase